MAVDLMTDGGNMFSVCRSICTTARKSVNATNDMEVAQMVLTKISDCGNKVELLATDVDDIGIAER